LLVQKCGDETFVENII